MNDKDIKTLGNAAARLHYATKNFEFLAEVEDNSFYDHYVNLYIVEERNSEGIHREYKSTRGVRELTIPKECWPQIRDILIEHYRRKTEEAYNEVVDNKEV